MTYREIREKSKEQLSGIRFRAIGSLAALLTAKLFFLFAGLITADFLLSNRIVGGSRLVVSSAAELILSRSALFFSELTVISVFGAALLSVYCRLPRFGFFKCSLNLIGLRLIMLLFKLPYLVCVYLCLIFARLIFFEYNALSSELAITVLMLLCAVCFLLLYFYLLTGLFVAPLLIAQGDGAFSAAVRSLRLMKKNRARLLRFLLRSLPEALLIFNLPQVVMRLVVLAGDFAHIYSDDI